MKANLTKGLLLFACLGLANAVQLQAKTGQDLTIDEPQLDVATETSAEPSLDIDENGGGGSGGSCCGSGCNVNPCTNMNGCLSLTGCGSDCTLPTFTPYDFTECGCSSCSTTCGGCIETTHADEFCLSGTH